MHVLLTGRYLFEGKEAAVVFANNKSLTFDLNKPEYEHIDKSALDLLKKMLSTAEISRISAYDCLHHEFLRSSEVP
jgi:serine/threonine protein kinase